VFSTVYRSSPVLLETASTSIILQVSCLYALSIPVVHQGEEVAGIVAFVLLLPEPDEATWKRKRSGSYP